MKRWQRALAFSTLALTGALTLLAACGGDDDDEAFELPPAGEYSFEVTGTIEVEIVREEVSAAPLAAGQRQTGEVSGSLTIQLADDGSFTIKDTKGVDLLVVDVEGGPIHLAQNEATPSSGNVGPEGTTIELKPEATLPSGETATSEAPIKLESADHLGPDSSVTLTTPADAAPPYYRVEYAEFTANFLFVLLELEEIEEDEQSTPTPTPAPAATPTPAATPAPTPAPTPEPSTATLSLDCDHRIPNVESDVIVTVSGLQSEQTVSGSVTGPGVIGEGTFSAVANADGTAEARVPINQFGSYNVTVDGLSGSIEVGEVCPQG